MSEPQRRVSLARSQAEIVVVAFGLLETVSVGITGSVAALGDTLFPAVSLRASLIQDSSSENILLRLRFLHSMAAATAAIYVLWIILKTPKSNGRVSNQVVMLAGLLISQICLGILNVLLLAPVGLQLVHLLVAELSWVLVVIASATLLLPAVESDSEPTLIADFTAPFGE